MPTIKELEKNLGEIQGNVIRGYRPWFAAYMFFEITDKNRAKELLKELVDSNTELNVTYSDRWESNNGGPSGARYTLNIAFSFRGLEKLELDKRVLNSFPEEFRDGMLSRAVKFLGDEPNGNWEPKNWDEKFKSENIHGLVIISTLPSNKEEAQAAFNDAQKMEMLRNTLKEECDNKVAALEHMLAQSDRGIHLVHKELAGRLPNPVEHFGFADGISQPFIEGTEELYKDNPNAPYAGQGAPVEEWTWEQKDLSNTKEFKKGEGENPTYWKHVKPGEILLGYEDEFGQVAQAPFHPDLRNNGTFLVFRKLEQNVPAFRKFLKDEAKNMWASTNGHDENYFEELLAAKLMGRWRSGCPLELSPEKDDKAIAGDPTQNNAFTYHQDEDGGRCPLGAHIRRTNPRDQILSAPSNFLKDDDDKYHLNRHRIIRRGLTYGPELPETAARDDDTSRGVIFMALNASISRQFEFLQQQWVNKGGFLGLDTTDRDPIIGKKDDNNKVTVPGAKAPFVKLPDPFVTERGGEYFFYPGRTALQGLADGKFETPEEGTAPKPLNFLAEFDALESVPNPGTRAIAQQRLLFGWLKTQPRLMFEDLHASNRTILEAPEVPHPIPGESPIRRRVILACKHADVLKIMQNPSAYSVALYAQPMQPPHRGPFVLGMEAESERYKKEIALLREVILPEDLETDIRPATEAFVGEVMKKKKAEGTIDVIQDVVWPAAINLVRKYFGVLGPDQEESNHDTLKRWCRDLFVDIFLNPKRDPDVTLKADRVVSETNAYLENLIKTRRINMLNGAVDPQNENTVLTRLIRQSVRTGANGEPESFDDGLDGVRRNIFGMIVGVVENFLRAVPKIIHTLLEGKEYPNGPEILAKAQKAARDGNDEEVLKYALEALRFNPQGPALFRICVQDTPLGGKTVPGGSLVCAGTMGAMFDKEAFPYPHEFKIDRPFDKSPFEKYLFFGYGPHECLGKAISLVLIPILVKHVLALEDLAIDPEKKKEAFDPIGREQEHFHLTFKVENETSV